MKKILFIWFVSVGLLTSCVENPEEDPDPVAPIGDLQVDFDGSHFTSATATVVLNETSLSIKGANDTGAFFKISIPEAPILGTYTLDEVPGLVLEYNQNNGSDPYVAAKDDTGPFASFADYTNTAQLVITNIDRVNKRISGTFKFTGVRFADALHTAVNTKVFTNGSFYSLPYTATEVVNPSDNLLVKRVTNSYPGSGIADQTSDYFYNGNKILREVYTDSDGLQETDTYLYDNDLITQIEATDVDGLIERETFQYTNNKLTTYVLLDFWEETGVKETYTHNPDGSISVERFTGDLDSQTTPDGTSTIYFVGGEIDHITFSSGTTKTFTYDNKNNPFKNVTGFDKIAFVDGETRGGISHNILTSVNTLPDFTFTYTYDVQTNYPLTSTIIAEGEESVVRTITYY